MKFGVVPDVVQVILDGVPFPKQATPGSAGVDLYVASYPSYVDSGAFGSGTCFFIEPRCYVKVGTGLRLNMTKVPGLHATVHMRSSVGAAGLCLANGTGIIDNDYQGEIQLVLYNRNAGPYKVALGDRVAQLVFQKYEVPWLVKVDEFAGQSVRGVGGFGSTGQ